MGVEHSDDLRYAFRSERLIYRALEDNDVDKAFFHEFNNDPIQTAMSSMGALKPWPLTSFEKYREWTKECPLFTVVCLPPLAKDADGNETDVRVPPREVATSQLKDATPIGILCLQNKGGPAATSLNRGANLGISLATPFTGKGYGGEAVNWVLDWGFRRLSLHRIDLGTWGNNANAIKLYRSLGFVEEGREREALRFDRQWVDIVAFGMLEGEWEKLRGISS